jgi:hypothetical protein
VKRCVYTRRRGHWRKRSCSRPRSRTSHAETAKYRVNSGFSNPPLSSVVSIYLNGRPHCSGTLITRGLVVTAGHCLYSNNIAAQQNAGFVGWFQNYNQLTIAPGAYINTNLQLVWPYGHWNVTGSYVPPRWITDDLGQDWGIALIGPDASGKYPGDYAGESNLIWNASIPADAHFYNVGYPASGPFSQDNLYNGFGQYFCDTIWDGRREDSNSSYGLLTEPCEMNGGSSGGPVYAEFSDGSFNVVGVNNIGGDRGDGFGNYGLSWYMDGDFASFWDATVNAISGARHARVAVSH